MENPMPNIAETDPQIQEKVLAAVAKALDLESERIDPDSSLEQDLGAESLDYLDLAFLLEKEFKVRLPRRSVLERAEEHLGQGVLVRSGQVTELGLKVLRQTMPEVDAADIRDGLRAAEVGQLLTSRTFERVVRLLLEAKQEAQARGCSKCNGTLQAAERTPELVCLDCGELTPLPSGDEVLFRQVADLDLGTANE